MTFDQLQSALIQLAEAAAIAGTDDEPDNSGVYLAMRDVHLLVGTIRRDDSTGLGEVA